MEKRKFYTLLLWVILSVAVINVPVATAQAVTGKDLKNMTPEKRADFQTGMMKSKLKLDTEQVMKVKAINLKYALKFQPIIKSDDSRFTKFRQAEKLLGQKDEELKQVFTTAQFKQYKDFESDMRKKMMAKAN